MIYGRAGSGKTWLGLIIAIAVTTKESIKIGPWESKESIGTLYIDGESTEYTLQSRLKQLRRGLKSAEAPFFILSSSSLIGYGQEPVYLTDNNFREEIYQYLKDHPQFRLIILDNVSALSPGRDENSKQDWDEINQWLIKLRFLDVSVVIIHHAGKENKREFRGTLSMADALDSVICVKKDDKGYETIFSVEFIKRPR